MYGVVPIAEQLLSTSLYNTMKPINHLALNIVYGFVTWFEQNIDGAM
jgi:hypothetical protein